MFGEWRTEDDDDGRGDEDQRTRRSKLRLLRGYLGGLNQTHVALQRWVDDTKLVLDRLSSVAADDSAGRPARRRASTSRRLGVFGHSMGGVTAGAVLRRRSPLPAGLNLDGIPQYGTMIDGRCGARS